MWMEERLGKRVNQERTDEASATGADILGVACPFCLVMLDDGVKAKRGDMRVLDIAQVVAESVGAADGPAPAQVTAEGAADAESPS
jgi:Fe-S oxidoreductase